MRTPQPFPLLSAAALVCFAFGSLAAPCRAQDANPMSFPNTKQVLGLEGVKRHAAGTLAAEDGNLVFTSSGKKTTVPCSSITEMMTNHDTERTIGGTVGTLSMFAPYGGGRFLSLFREKISVLAITYVDSSGGVHGAVFTFPAGNSHSAKKALMMQGAKTSIAPEAEVDEQAKPKEKKQ